MGLKGEEQITVPCLPNNELSLALSNPFPSGLEAFKNFQIPSSKEGYPLFGSLHFERDSPLLPLSIQGAPHLFSVSGPAGLEHCKITTWRQRHCEREG